MTRRMLGTIAVAAIAFAFGVWFDSSSRLNQSLVAQAPPLPFPPAAVEDRPVPPPVDRFEQVIRQVSASVVSVDAVKPASGVVQATKGKSTEESGSGVLLKIDGQRGTFAITNNHVVGGARPEEITVTLADGRIVIPDHVWADPESDIALLRLPLAELPTLQLADSDRVRVGQWVLAFGSPFGLNQTVTHGIISAKDRGQISLGATIRIKEFLQTDAAINPGSSGGPLVDLSGAIVGINTAIASTNGNNSGVSFSIPSNLIKRITRELLEKGYVSRGYLGLQLAATLDPQTALKLGLTRVWGALIEGVHPSGPAERAGLQSGDVILRLDAIDIRDENHLINLISGLPANQRVQLTIWRARQAKTIEVTIGDWATIAGRVR
jgi:serine protease Do